ncbi:MAG: methylated-DNA--[protein]-cysteine S-methyltransferase [Candidatus Levyibacteriota bacterium]
MIYTIFSSPMGDILVTSDGEKILRFGFVGQKYLVEVPKEWAEKSDHKLLSEAKRQTDDYFSGKRKQFELPLFANGTPFQKKVWRALETIPFGQVTSYREIARKIGNPKAVRAVGAAIGRNPIGIIIPCHRVIGTNGTLTGYAGGLDRKQLLLKLEGVVHFTEYSVLK